MGKKEKTIKTNAMRMLDRAGIDYKVHFHDSPEGFQGGTALAEALGEDPDMVYKTLVTQGHSGEHYVCVIPVAQELDFKKAASHFHEKNIEMIHAKDITKVTGYIKGGCSPVGMKKPFKTVIQRDAEKLESFCVSGGKIGLQIELNPEDLLKVIDASFDDVIKE